ncbi:hypothetical protein D3C87_1752230 [compost metagenome]
MSSAFSAETLRPISPITMPSSTSQSSLVEFSGTIVSSFGPQIADGALRKTIGSAGIGKFDSAACSE